MFTPFTEINTPLIRLDILLDPPAMGAVILWETCIFFDSFLAAFISLMAEAFSEVSCSVEAPHPMCRLVVEV